MKNTCLFLFLALFWVAARASEEVPQSLTLDGRLYSSAISKTPLLDTGTFKIQVLDFGGTCVLYEETQGFDTRGSDGYFNINIGEKSSGTTKRTAGDSGHTLTAVFANNGGTLSGKLLSNGAACSGSAAVGNTRSIQITVTPDSDPTPRAMTPFVLNSVPSAFVAERAESLQGIAAGGFLQVKSTAPYSLSQANLENVFSNSNYPKLTDLLAGTSNFYARAGANGAIQAPSIAGTPSSPAAGQIWYDSGVVKYYDGTSTQTLSAGSGITSLIIGSGLTPTGTISTGGQTIAVDTGLTAGKIVQVQTGGKLPALDGSDLTNVTASAFSSTGSISTSGSVSANAANFRSLTLTNAGSQTITLNPAASITGSPISFTLPAAMPASNGYVLSSTTAGVMSWVAPATGGLAAVSNTASLANGKTWIGDAGGVAQEKFIGMADIRSSQAGNAQFFPASACSAGQTLSWQSGTDTLVCSNISLATSALTGSISLTSQVTGVLPIANGGTGSSTQNFVDLTTAQTVAGVKTYSNNAIFNGSVGIGTSTPVGPFHIESLGQRRFRLGTGGDVQIQVPAGGTTTAWTTIGSQDTTSPILSIWDGNLVEKVTVSSTGSVGIGTATPGDLLHVEGKIRGTHICATDGTNCKDLTTAWTGGGGTVTSVTAGTGLTGGTITGSGTIGLGTELAGVNALSTTGFVKRTGAGAYSTASSLSLTADVTGTLPIANGGTNSSATLNNDRLMISSGGAIVEAGAMTNGQLVVGKTSDTPQIVTMSGDATISNTGVLALKNTGTAGTYAKITTDAQGRVTSGTTLSAADIPNLDWSKITSGTPTTLSGYGITNAVTNAGGTVSIESGLDGSRPAAGTAGRIYFATDAAKIYRDNGTIWETIASNSGTGISALTGDVTASGSGSVAATVASVGGVTAANVALGATAANAATNANTASTIIKRDANGDFISRDANLRSVILRDSGSNTATLQAPAAIGTSYTLKMPTGLPGVAGYVLSSDTSGNLSWIAPTTGSLTEVSNAANLANGKVWIGDGTGKAQEQSVTGDITLSSAGAAKVVAIQNKGVSATAPTTAGQVLRYDGTNWTPNFISMFDLRSTITGSAAFGGVGCLSNQTLTWTSATDNLACSNISLPASQLTGTAAAFLLNGGQAGAVTAGTTDATSLTFVTNNAAKMTVLSGGNVGIGITNPTARLEVRSNPTNIGMANMSGVMYSYATSNGAYATSSINTTNSVKVAAGITNTASQIGHVAYSYRNWATTSDNGSLTGDLTGIEVGVGHFNTDATATPQTNNAYGIKIAPYYRTGTIGNLYDFYISPDAVGGTVTNHYGIYQANSAKNVLNGSVGIGTTNPTKKLTVRGTGAADGILIMPSATNGGEISAQDDSHFDVTNGRTSNPTISMPQYGIAFPAITASAETWVSGNGGVSLFTTALERLRVAANGNVGIGTANPNTKLEVAGAIVSTTNPVPTGASVNLTSSNTHTLADIGGTAITLSGMVDGGTYTLIVTDPASRAYTFTGCTSSFYKPTNAATNLNTRTIYGILTIKNGANWDCYINWTSGYQ